jgi:hypothetical protein
MGPRVQSKLEKIGGDYEVFDKRVDRDVDVVGMYQQQQSGAAC